jgi:hypothetical protein
MVTFALAIAAYVSASRIDPSILPLSADDDLQSRMSASLIRIFGNLALGSGDRRKFRAGVPFLFVLGPNHVPSRRLTNLESTSLVPYFCFPFCLKT